MKANIGMIAGVTSFISLGCAGDVQAEPLDCVTRSIVQCVSTPECTSGLPEAFEVPPVMRLDFEGMTIATDIMSGMIDSVYNDTPFIMAEGRIPDTDRLWSLTYNEETSRFTATVAGEDEGYVLFGVCIENS